MPTGCSIINSKWTNNCARWISLRRSISFARRQSLCLNQSNNPDDKVQFHLKFVSGVKWLFSSWKIVGILKKEAHICPLTHSWTVTFCRFGENGWRVEFDEKCFIHFAFGNNTREQPKRETCDADAFRDPMFVFSLYISLSSIWFRCMFLENSTLNRNACV